jgi:hypothetical protein
MSWNTTRRLTKSINVVAADVADGVVVDAVPETATTPFPTAAGPCDIRKLGVIKLFVNAVTVCANEIRVPVFRDNLRQLTSGFVLLLGSKRTWRRGSPRPKNLSVVHCQTP